MISALVFFFSFFFLFLAPIGGRLLRKPAFGSAPFSSFLSYAGFSRCMGLKGVLLPPPFLFSSRKKKAKETLFFPLFLMRGFDSAQNRGALSPLFSSPPLLVVYVEKGKKTSAVRPLPLSFQGDQSKTWTKKRGSERTIPFPSLLPPTKS